MPETEGGVTVYRNDELEKEPETHARKQDKTACQVEEKGTDDGLGGFICTRPEGHEGVHKAHGLVSEVCAEWPQENGDGDE